MGIYTKAIVASIMSILLLLNTFAGISFDLDEATITTVVNAIIAVLTPLGVFTFSNRPTS